MMGPIWYDGTDLIWWDMMWHETTRYVVLIYCIKQCKEIIFIEVTDGLVQDYTNAIANALKLLQSCAIDMWTSKLSNQIYGYDMMTS